MPKNRTHLVVSCIVLCAILAIALISLNVAADSRNMQRAQSVLALVLQNGEDPEILLSSTDAADSETAQRVAVRTGVSAYEALKTSSYFTARTDARGEILSVDTDHAVEMDDAEARTVCEVAVYENRNDGTTGTFAYLRVRDGEEYCYAFLDISKEKMQQITLATSSVAIGAIAAAALILYAALMAGLVTAPLSRRTEEAAQLLYSYEEQLRCAEKTRGSIDTARIADGLHAAADALEANEKKRVFSLTAMTETCVKACGAQIRKKSGHIVEKIQKGVYIRAKEKQMHALVKLLLNSAASDMKEEGKVYVDLLSDGKNVGLLVRSSAASTNPSIDGDLLAVCRLIACENDGRASFELIEPATMCYTVRLKSAEQNYRR